MENTEERYELTGPGIDDAAEAAYSFLTAARVERKNALRVRLTLADKLVTPVFDTFMGLLTAISGPMIFLSVTWGICCIGDVASFGRIGRRMIARFILFTVVLTVAAGAAVLPFFRMAAGGGRAFDPSELLDMVLDIVPSNFFTPFTEGNPLQIIFVAVLIGMALLLLGEKVSVAAYPTNQDCCEKRLGINEKITRFGIPLGQVIYMPGAAVLFLVAGLCMAEIYDVPITPAWLLTSLFICVMLAIAAPPVPGSTLTCYTLLFTQLGMPMEAVAIMTALNVILEFLATASDLFCLQMALTDLGGSLQMLDVDTLRSRNC